MKMRLLHAFLLCHLLFLGSIEGTSKYISVTKVRFKSLSRFKMNISCTLMLLAK